VTLGVLMLRSNHLHTRLILEPDPSQEEEGSGHSPTFELSTGRNVDLIANDVMKMVFLQAFSVASEYVW